jgi:hypothetical protein
VTVGSRIRNAPKAFDLSVRMRPRGGDVHHTVMDRDGLEHSGARHILLLIHGFNNTEDDAADAYGKFFRAMEQALKKSHVAPDAVARFFWPGDLAVSPFRFAPLDAVGYPKDIEQAFASAASLARYLEGLPRPGPDAASLKLSLVGHSLGCRVVLHTLQNVAPALRPDIVFIGLMAAAVGVGLAGTGTPYARFASPREKLVKYTSTRDLVLFGAFPAGQAAAFATGVEGELHREAIGRNGNPQSFGVDVRTVHGHGDYWPDDAIARGVVERIDATMVAPARGAAIPANALPLRGMPPPRRLGRRSLPS